ncbi:MAG: CRISPR-associated endonuclease Cas2 [Magnetococcales bacterium]|nr:CRISPR-associated endonuclease Cas2 [Magnetococcales bacterium]MBF0440030.1 CRISPR-associated endonuclease Cas2 [Magnetococcales bacterium]
MDAHRYVICYDVSDNKRRRHLAVCLDQYGERIQESVFEAVLERPLLKQMIEDVGKQINDKADAVRIYTLCATCAGKVERLGIPGPVPGEEKVFVV